MRRFKIVLVLCILCCVFTGCNATRKKTQQSSEEKTTEISTSTNAQKKEKKMEDENIIAQGSGKDATPNDANASISDAQELPDTMEPLGEGDKMDPKFTNLSLMEYEDFNRSAILDGVLSYMYKEGLSKDTCTNINIDEKIVTNSVSYIITISFEEAEDRRAVLIRNKNHYDVQVYIELEDSEITPDG